MRAARRTDRYHWAWHRSARYVAQRLILRSVVQSTVRVSVEGEANLEGLERPYVVVSNHSSHLDAPLLVTALPWRITRHMATGVAADYFYNSRWRSTLTSLFFNSYPVERGRGKKREAGLSVTLLREKVPLAIFPEGTRSRTGQMGRFTPGVGALARALRVPVLPLALVGAHDAMPPGASWPKKGRLPVKVLIGKPIHARRGETLPELNERVYTQVWHMLTNQTPYVLVPESPPSASSGQEDEAAGERADSGARRGHNGERADGGARPDGTDDDGGARPGAAAAGGAHRDTSGRDPGSDSAADSDSAANTGSAANTDSAAGTGEAADADTATEAPTDTGTDTGTAEAADAGTGAAAGDDGSTTRRRKKKHGAKKAGGRR